MEDYYHIKRCSNSALSQIKRELLGVDEMKASPATLYFGEQFHKALLEPSKFAQDSLTDAQMYQLATMTKTANKCSLLKLMLGHPKVEIEKPVFWDFNGVPFKCKMDARIPGWIIDPKTTACTSITDFIDTCGSYGYFRQAALYMNATGDKKFTFIGVPKNVNITTPFIVNAHEFPIKLTNALHEAEVLSQHWMLKNKIK